MIVAAHQTMMAPPALPYDAEVEYLESTGTQYVDTGITGITSALSCRAVISAGSWSQNSTVVGVFTGSTRFYSIAIDNGVYACSFSGRWNNSYAPKITGIPTDSFVSVSSEISSAGVSISVDSTTKSTSRSDGWSGSGNITVFKRGGESQTSYASIKLASLDLFVGSTIVRDFQPVRVGQTGYLFDRVTGQLFGNAGTGAFTIGPDK